MHRPAARGPCPALPLPPPWSGLARKSAAVGGGIQADAALRRLRSVGPAGMMIAAGFPPEAFVVAAATAIVQDGGGGWRLRAVRDETLASIERRAVFEGRAGEVVRGRRWHGGWTRSRAESTRSEQIRGDCTHRHSFGRELRNCLLRSMYHDW